MLKFWLSETFISIKKAQASFILSVISTTIAVSLMLATILIIYTTDRFDKSVKEKLSLNLFLKESAGEQERQIISEKLHFSNYIKNFTYWSKEAAAEKFIQDTGEDFTRILDYNPLPASFEIFLKDQYVDKDSITRIQQELQNLSGVDEVSFNADIYYKIIDYLKRVKNYIIGLTILILLISVYLVFSTNRLILQYRYEEMGTMKLIGATLLSIKMPVVLNSVFIGLLSGGFAILLFIAARSSINLISGEIPSNYFRLLFIAALLTGPALGILTSLISMRRISIKI